MRESQNDITNIVKQKLMDLGFRVSPSNKYTFVIENENGTKLIKVINTKSKYAHWKASKNDEEVNNDLYYICVRNDGEYKYHIIPSSDFSKNIKEYHNSFIEKNGKNGAVSAIREFLDKPSIHIPNKEENEYLDNWSIL